MGFNGLKIKVLAGLVPTRGSGGESTSSPFPISRGRLHSLAHGPSFLHPQSNKGVQTLPHILTLTSTLLSSSCASQDPCDYTGPTEISRIISPSQGLLISNSYLLWKTNTFTASRDEDLNHDSLGSHDSSYHTYLCSNHVNEPRTHSMKPGILWLLQTSPPPHYNLVPTCAVPTCAVPSTSQKCTACVLPPVPLEEVATSYSSNHASTLLRMIFNYFSPGLLKMKEKACSFLYLSILLEDKPPLPVSHKDLLIIVKIYSFMSACCVS